MYKKIFLLYLLSSSLYVNSQDLTFYNNSISDLNPKEEKEFIDKLLETYEKSQNEVKLKAKELNIPLSFKDNNNNLNVLFYFEGDKPFYKVVDNFGSARTARVNHINSGGSMGLNLNGQGMNVGVWDGGPIRTSHVDLVGRVTIKDAQNFFQHDDDTEHATHVSGTIVSSGSSDIMSRGLAYQANIFGHTFANDTPEVLQFAREGGLVSNHSYGVRISSVPEMYRGFYSNESKTWDDLTYAYPYFQPVISAGNDRGTANDNTGYDLLIGNKNSKNAIVVAAVNQVVSYNGPTSVTMSSFSSWGPTDDFRIKPDISAKGVGVMSLSSSSDNAKVSLQGTSMAAPAVSATLTLFQQHYKNLYNSFMRASTLKALMTNSADEAGPNPGPDHMFGWGLINGQQGVSVISNRNTTSIIEELELSNQSIYENRIVSTGGKLKVTIAWTDLSGDVSSTITQNDRTSKLINDLDIRLEKDGLVSYPWVLNRDSYFGGALKQDNNLDNIEQIEIDSPSGIYNLRVSHKGNLTNPQKFSLVISNGIFENLSTNEFNVINNLKIYPNPSNGLINFSTNNIVSCNINVFDIQGRIVKEVKNVDISSNNPIDLTSLNKGVYLIRVISNKDSFSSKIILN